MRTPDNRTLLWLSQDDRQSAVPIVHKKGIPAAEIGWRKDAAMKVLRGCREEGVGVVGGDVYLLLPSGALLATTDNWFTERMPEEGQREFALRSVDQAERAVLGYRARREGEPIFVLVFDNKST